MLRTGADLLIDKQRARLTAVFANDQHVEVEASWGIYQRIVGAYRDPDRAAGKAALTETIETISNAVPATLTELTTLGRTLQRRAPDVLAYLRGTAIAFRNLANYITRALLDTGGFRRRIHPHMPLIRIDPNEVEDAADALDHQAAPALDGAMQDAGQCVERCSYSPSSMVVFALTAPV